MFQNIAKDFQEESYNREDQKQQNKRSAKDILKKLFSIQNIILYAISFLVSMVGFSSENLILSIGPFAISFLAAMLSNYMPVGIVYVLTLIGTWLKFGPSSVLTYFLTTLVFFAFVLFKRPQEEELVNEKRRLGLRVFLSVLLVQIVPMFFRNFYVYDLLTSIMLAIASFVFYKIFANSIPIIKDLGRKTVFSVEEVMGTSLLLAISVCAFGDFSIFGFSIKNILSILIVLILGWKNGMLIGATSGVTIGVTLGIIGGSEPTLVASYAISGMIAGLFNRLGKVGVVIGFILGNIALTYVENGNTVPIILIQEILIAFLGLLAVPKKVKIDIADFYGREKLLPETTGISLTENDDTIFKLNSMSEAISDMAKSYQEAASTVVSEEELKEQELSNEQIFQDELKINLQEIEDNMLYEEIEENQTGIVDDIFHHLLQKEVITEKELVAILEEHNNYLVGFYEKNEQVIEDVSKMIKAINSAYRMSKLNFVWKKKMEESKKTVSSQLEGVSQAISHLADEMKEDVEQEDPFATQKQEIQALIKEKDINIEQIKIKQTNTGKYFIEVYTKLCDEIDGTKCDIKKIIKILTKVLKDKFLIQNQECGLRENKPQCKFTYMSDDKYKLQVGIASATKADSPVSGDSYIETKLEDGKYLVAISDGMGSGPEAMKSSKIAIKMLERLLKAGFEKEVSMQLINSTLAATSKEDMYATLDIQILDLFSGNMEFMKNGACPTFLKRNGEVQLLKSITLPAGVLDKNDLIVYDYDLQEGDIVVMCSDGIIEANSEYLNKELWVKYLLEDISSDDAQQIANIILEEAIDSGYGRQKDDMTVLVSRISKKKSRAEKE